jgi:two-component system alkaline phosphatase synthesis response regulator PhoP
VDKPRVLIVEDDPTLQDLLLHALEKEYFEASVAGDGNEAYALLRVNAYDVVILDIILPGMNGIDVLKAMRYELNVATPVIILSGRGQLEDRLAGLDLGANDYITKPFELPELVARVKAQLRQAERMRMAMEEGMVLRRKHITFGNVTVDRDARSVVRGGVEVYLRPKEFDLLIYLVERPGVVCNRRDIMDAVWGQDSPSGMKAVDVTMRSLRQKVEDTPALPKHLITARNAGYKFQF